MGALMVLRLRLRRWLVLRFAGEPAGRARPAVTFFTGMKKVTKEGAFEYQHPIRFTDTESGPGFRRAR